MKDRRSKLYLVGVIIAITIFLLLKNNRSAPPPQDRDRQEQRDRDTARPRPRAEERNKPRRENDRPPSDEPGRETGFDRRIGPLVLTKHARCRMACRHIDESEIKEILETGTINDRKSEPAARPDPKYAVEGKTHDGQQVRIIFAPSSRGMVVVTVIDLDTDWTCDCK